MATVAIWRSTRDDDGWVAGESGPCAGLQGRQAPRGFRGWMGAAKCLSGLSASTDAPSDWIGYSIGATEQGVDAEGVDDGPPWVVLRVEADER